MDSPAVHHAISAPSKRAVQRAMETIRDWSPPPEQPPLEAGLEIRLVEAEHLRLFKRIGAQTH
jgi:hypothetical protein